MFTLASVATVSAQGNYKLAYIISYLFKRLVYSFVIDKSFNNVQKKFLSHKHDASRNLNMAFFFPRLQLFIIATLIYT